MSTGKGGKGGKGSKTPTTAPSSKGKGGKGTTLPTATPTASPTPCQDNPDRFPVGGVTQACQWVINGGGPAAIGSIPWRCNAFPEAMANCKQSCGLCGCVDTTERFFIPGDSMSVSRSCAWVARKDTATRCAMDGVRFRCPLTCGNCP